MNRGTGGSTALRPLSSSTSGRTRSESRKSQCAAQYRCTIVLVISPSKQDCKLFRLSTINYEARTTLRANESHHCPRWTDAGISQRKVRWWSGPCAQHAAIWARRGGEEIGSIFFGRLVATCPREPCNQIVELEQVVVPNRQRSASSRR